MIFKDVGEPDGATLDIDDNYWSARVRENVLYVLIQKMAKSLKKLISLLAHLLV